MVHQLGRGFRTAVILRAMDILSMGKQYRQEFADLKNWLPGRRLRALHQAFKSVVAYLELKT